MRYNFLSLILVGFLNMVVLGCYRRFRLLFYINKDIKILIWGIVVGLYFGNRVK